ncbi:MAG: hypothetical protein LBH01_10020 [Verrucomicrobiales bacterium]|jgi:hypothetical protein|nr:hypothetical protein [Verrucomicrobiales bacterium]
MSRLKIIQRYMPIGALGLSIILHLAIFLGISGIIIIRAVTPKVPFLATEAAPAPVEPTPPVDPQDETPNPNTTETSDDAAPAVSTNIEQIYSQNTSATAFTIPPNLGVSVSSVNGMGNNPFGKGTGSKKGGGPGKISNPFGSTDVTTGALIGTMYDLKQTADRKATEFAPDSANEDYHKFLQKFVDSGWNPNTLNKFYKVDRPLGTYQIFIPTIMADEAPAAFKAEQYVQPKRWIIIYHGDFTAPEDGTYRFVGVCDDILVVRLNNNNVMDGSLFSVVSKGVTREKTGLAYNRANGIYQMYAGNWFQLRAGQSYPIDIMIGEQPGGHFNAFLLIQQKGKEYPKQSGGDNLSLVLPVFQTAPTPIPSGDQAPQVAKQAFIAK